MERNLALEIIEYGYDATQPREVAFAEIRDIVMKELFPPAPKKKKQEEQKSGALLFMARSEAQLGSWEPPCRFEGSVSAPQLLVVKDRNGSLAAYNPYPPSHMKAHNVEHGHVSISREIGDRVRVLPEPRQANYDRSHPWFMVEVNPAENPQTKWQFSVSMDDYRSGQLLYVPPIDWHARHNLMWNHLAHSLGLKLEKADSPRDHVIERKENVFYKATHDATRQEFLVGYDGFNYVQVQFPEPRTAAELAALVPEGLYVSKVDGKHPQGGRITEGGSTLLLHAGGSEGGGPEIANYLEQFLVKK